MPSSSSKQSSQSYTASPLSIRPRFAKQSTICSRGNGAGPRILFHKTPESDSAVLCRDWVAARGAGLDMSARGKLQGALVEALEAKQERRRSARPAREAMRLLRLNEQLMSVGVDDHNGIAAEQRTGRHLPLMGIVGRDEVRPIGIASGQPFVLDPSENPLGGGIDVGVVAHDSCHCLTIPGASALAVLIAAAIASLEELNSRMAGAFFPPTRVYSCSWCSSTPSALSQRRTVVHSLSSRLSNTIA